MFRTGNVNLLRTAVASVAEISSSILVVREEGHTQLTPEVLQSFSGAEKLVSHAITWSRGFSDAKNAALAAAHAAGGDECCAAIG
jgi:hypothetical protein